MVNNCRKSLKQNCFSIDQVNYNRMKKTSPAWTIQSKYPNSKYSDTPSPAGYRPDRWKSQHAPSWKIGTSPRNRSKDKGVPGPGQYNTNKSTINNKMGKFSFQDYRKEKKQLSPDPLTYSPNFQYVRPSSPMNKFKEGKPKDKPQNTPGPGAYEKYTKSNSKLFKIGRQPRFSQKRDQSPDPATYNPLNKWFKEVSVSFTQTRKDKSAEVLTPGPGSYNSQQGWLHIQGESKMYTIASKPQQEKQNMSPGPTDYNPCLDFVLKQSQKVSISTKHPEHQIDKTPGPADYNNSTISKSKPKYSIGRERRDRTTTEKLPGPGSYEITSRKNSPSFSLRGSRLAEQKFKTPGPGAYDPNRNNVKRRPGSATIGNSKKGLSCSFHNPGPGDYSPFIRPSSAQGSFGKQKKCCDKLATTPGPGAYENPSTIGIMS